MERYHFAVTELAFVLSRVLNNLTQALQSSGVDLSQASISVQINVGSRVDSGLTSMASSSKVGLESSTVALNPILNVTAASATDVFFYY